MSAFAVEQSPRAVLSLFRSGDLAPGPFESGILSFAKNASAGIALRCNAFITVMQAAEVRDLNDPANAR